MTDQLRDEAVEALTESEVKRLETLAQQEVEKEQKAELRKRYMDQFKKKLRQQTGIEEGVEEVTIDCAKHADGITIDGVKYLHGGTYTVKRSLAIELRHIMQTTYEHQAEIDGKPKRYYRDNRRDAVISPHGTVNASTILRV